MNQNERVYRLLILLDQSNEISSVEKECLFNCKELNWSFSSMVQAIPKSIKVLRNLKTLNLMGIGLSDLPDELCELESLQELILSGNNLSELPKRFPELKNLKILDLSQNRWNTFPNEIKPLKELVYLNISDCSFPNLPGWLLDYQLDFFFYRSNHGIIMERTMAPEIAVFKKPRETIIKYYTKLAEEGLIVRESKVVFLGDGEAGKTYTIDRIKAKGQKLSEKHQTDETKGISIAHLDFVYDEKVVSVNFWDFGGQHIMHAMHRCFLTGSTLYVVVLSGRAEDMERRLHYWMTTINSFASSKCHVVVLENLFAVKNERHVDKAKFCRLYNNIIDIVPLNVKDAEREEFNSFVDTLLNNAIKYTHYGQTIPKHWADVKKNLEESKLPFLPKEEFTQMIGSVSPSALEDELDILDWLNDLGTSFSCHRNRLAIIAKEYVVLNPEWATNAIYAIITNQDGESENGIISHKAIEDILRRTKFVNNGDNINRSYSPANISYILALMKIFQISFPLQESITDETEEFIPSLCCNDEPEGIEEFFTYYDIRFDIDFSYLPSNILHRFMIDHFSELKEPNKWWYSGGLFFSEAYQCLALIMRVMAQNEDDRIEIYVRSIREDRQSNEAWRYLEFIRKEFREISGKMNISPKKSFLYYTEPGMSISERIDLDVIGQHIKNGWRSYRSTFFQKEIPIRVILKSITPIYNSATNRSLLFRIIAGCSYMQKRTWLPRNENDRNDYLCDLFRSAQINVLDQTRSGRAQVGSGELDFLFLNRELQDEAIMEALYLTSVDKDEIRKHIKKLTSDEHYNTLGLKELYMLAYADVTDFVRFCNGYYLQISEDMYYPTGIIHIENTSNPRQKNIAVWRVELQDGTVIHHIAVKIPKNRNQKEKEARERNSFHS